MNSQVKPSLTAAELLAQSVRIWCSRAGLFVMIMGIPMAALLVMEVFAIYAIFPPMSGAGLREVWRGLSSWKRIAVGVLFLFQCATYFRALAASVFAAQEIRSGRSVGFLGAVRSVRRPQLRLFWIVFLLCVLPGPLGWLLLPLLAFFVGPGLPVAILENRTASAAMKRGGVYVKGQRGRIALLVVLWLSLSAAGIIGVIWVADGVKVRFGVFSQRSFLFLGYWVVSLVAQWSMVALALNYLDARRREETVEGNG